jgi:phosphatidylserine/phosphatidylglycerophosphate/cardiolipin synthase-like enzyme
MSPSSRPEPELVITGPGEFGPVLAYHTGGRTTIGVLTQLFAEATAEVVLSAPFIQSGFGLMGGPLRTAVGAALARGVNVSIVTTADGLSQLSDAEFKLDAKGRLRLFRPLENLRDERRLGSHAKFCIADARMAYVGSANLTGPGLSGHVELGLLVTGTIAAKIWSFWEYCVEIGLFVETSS